MKKTKFLVMSLVLSVLMLAAGVLFAACDGGAEEPPAHTHTWSTEWSGDEDNHWQACTGEDCDAVNDEAAHTWNGGEVTTPATFEAPAPSAGVSGKRRSRSSNMLMQRSGRMTARITGTPAPTKATKI